SHRRPDHVDPRRGRDGRGAAGSPGPRARPPAAARRRDPSPRRRRPGRGTGRQRTERGRARAVRVGGLRPQPDARSLVAARGPVSGTDDLPAPLGAIAARPRLAALLGAVCIAFSGILYRWAEVSPSTGTVYRAVF